MSASCPNGDDNRISAGTFHPDDEGRSEMELTAAVGGHAELGVLGRLAKVRWAAGSGPMSGAGPVAAAVAAAAAAPGAAGVGAGADWVLAAMVTVAGGPSEEITPLAAFIRRTTVKVSAPSASANGTEVLRTRLQVKA